MKYAIERKRAYFTRYGCRAIVKLGTIVISDQNFYGADGRKVRAQAVAWARSVIARRS
jgi:hypothetical protein